MVESLNARFRQATRRSGHSPSEQPALKVLYLVVREKRKNAGNITGRINGWKQALNTFALYYGDRLN
jgi:putative transposase